MRNVVVEHTFLLLLVFKNFSEEGERNRQMHTRSDERMHPPARAMLLFKHKFCCALSRFKCYWKSANNIGFIKAFEVAM